jgi:tRNA (adenine22-N1)-methyltransferase
MARERNRPFAGGGRLEAVAALVSPGSRVADIGTDHGLLPRLLLATGRASHCIATEQRGHGMQRARWLAGQEHLALRLELREGFGLRVLLAADRLDVVVLSGLGARTILRILEDGRDTVPRIGRLVIQPQSEQALVRRWLFEHGHAIVDERIALDRGRFYVAMAAEPGAEPGYEDLSPAEREMIEEAGPCLLRSADPLVRDYWERTLHAQQRILRRTGRGSGKDEAERRLQLARGVLAVLASRRSLENRESPGD